MTITKKQRQGKKNHFSINRARNSYFGMIDSRLSLLYLQDQVSNAGPGSYLQQLADCHSYKESSGVCMTIWREYTSNTLAQKQCLETITNCQPSVGMNVLLGQTNLLARPLKFGKTIIVRLKTKLGTQGSLPAVHFVFNMVRSLGCTWYRLLWYSRAKRAHKRKICACFQTALQSSSFSYKGMQ